MMQLVITVIECSDRALNVFVFGSTNTAGGLVYL
jgi:hypothetical protein